MSTRYPNHVFLGKRVVEDEILDTSPHAGPRGAPSRHRSRLSLSGWSFHPTTDDWAGSFEATPEREGGLVAMTVFVDPDTDSCRVYAKGTDDTGYERCGFTREEARRFMVRLPTIITMAWLQSQGFVHI